MEQTNNQVEEELEKKKLNGAAVGLFLIVFIIWEACWSGTVLLADYPDGPGTFGDMFGSVNALFSGLAFAGVIYAILLQRRELELQRKELKTTNLMLKAQQREFSEQNITLRKQRFENTFFQMVSIHHEIVNSTTLKDIQGRVVFQRIYKKLGDEWVRSLRLNPNIDSIQRASDAYNKIYSQYQLKLGHYFRNLYRIFKFVDDSKFEETGIKDKQFYTDVLRAQLSNQELLILFYNCEFFEGGKNFKDYVETYALLDNLPFQHLLDPPGHIQRYKEKAYGGKYPEIKES